MLRKNKLSAAACLILFLLSPLNAYSKSSSELRKSLDELKILRQAIQKKTMPLLVLLKQLEGTEVGASQDKVKVIQSVAAVRESDTVASKTLLVARMNDEFSVLEQRDQWYRIRLADGREGWIHEDVVQLFSVSAPTMPAETKVKSPPETENILSLASALLQLINAKQDTASNIISEFEEKYQKLSPSEKNRLVTLFKEFSQEREKVSEYHVYANHYYDKYASSQQLRATTFSRVPLGFTGQVSMLVGRSAFESDEEESVNSRNLNFSGNMIINERSQITATVNHSNEVVQTPYSSNDVKLGYIYQLPGGLHLNTFASYKGYDDKNFDKNNFKDLGAGVNLKYPIDPKTLFFGDIAFNNKNYDEEGSNDYSGGQFYTGLQIKSNPNTQLNLALRGRVQSSDISFLDFRRFIPQIQYLRRKRSGSFATKLEFEQISYAEEAESNNFTRERIDLTWSKKGNQQQITVMGKQFPNNEDFNYFKFGLQTRWQSTAASRFSRTGLSVLYVYHPQGGDQLVDYLDVRADRSSSGKIGYFDLGLFGRVWQSSDRDHIVDFYNRFGWKISKVQIGPVLGAHLLLNSDDSGIKRDGNSFRVGLDVRGNFTIKKASINLTFSYERSFVYSDEIAINTETGELTTGDVEQRNPTTLQFSAGLRVPIARVIDFQLDIRHYNIDLDVNDAISINPVSDRSSLRILAGLEYRFDR